MGILWNKDYNSHENIFPWIHMTWYDHCGPVFMCFFNISRMCGWLISGYLWLIKLINHKWHIDMINYTMEYQGHILNRYVYIYIYIYRYIIIWMKNTHPHRTCFGISHGILIGFHGIFHGHFKVKLHAESQPRNWWSMATSLLAVAWTFWATWRNSVSALSGSVLSTIRTMTVD